jgi:hypothetical protein
MGITNFLLALAISSLAWDAPPVDLTVCASGCDYTSLQSAVTAANGGDRILLTAGETYTGQITLPAKASTVTITTAGTLPDRSNVSRNLYVGIGRWIRPGDAASLATISAGEGNTAALVFEDSANWLIDGINFARNPSSEGESIRINDSDNITLKRLMLNVTGGEQQKRFILGNGTNISVTESYCAGVWKSGQDSQCFIAYDGAGPYTIRDNYFEVASENIIFGGSDPSSAANIPSDITVEYNYCTKSEAWRTPSSGYQVKNIFQLKNAKRVRVRFNVFEKNWTDAQAGAAIVMTPVNQDGTAPQSGVTDVLFANNVIRDVEQGLNMTGYGFYYEQPALAPGGPTIQTTRITIRNNLWQMTTRRWAALSSELGTVTLDHNTAIGDGEAGLEAVFMGIDGEIAVTGEAEARAPLYSVNRLTYTNNFVQGNEYGFRSTNGFGNTTLSTRVNSYTWLENVLGMAEAYGGYPATTTVITKAQLHAQLDSANQYRLIAASPYRNAGTDGRDLGWHAPTPSRFRMREP